MIVASPGGSPMNQSFIIYIIQNMLLISLFILILFFIGRRVPLKAGHAWRKWLWAVLAVRLLLPVPVSVKLPVPENAAGAEEETEYSAGGSGEGRSGPCGSGVR